MCGGGGEIDNQVDREKDGDRQREREREKEKQTGRQRDGKKDREIQRISLVWPTQLGWGWAQRSRATHSLRNITRIINTTAMPYITNVQSKWVIFFCSALTTFCSGLIYQEQFFTSNIPGFTRVNFMYEQSA